MAKKEVNEKVKPIILRDADSGSEYTLEFNRESIRFAEMRGFDISDVDKFPMTKIPDLFYYSFRMHHKNVSREKTDRMIFEDWGGIGSLPEGLLERLILLYAEPFNATTTGEKPKNSKLTVEL